MSTTGIPNHIATFARDLYWSGGANGTSAQVRQYVTFAQGGLGNTKASADCNGTNGCSSVFYFDPNFLYDKSACGSSMDAATAGVLKNANETWFVHVAGYSDATHRIRGSFTMTCSGKTVTIPVYAMNSYSTSMQTYYRNYFHANASQFNYFMMDDTSARVLSQFYGPGGGFCWNVSPTHWCSTTQEMPTDTSVAGEHAALGSALTHPDGTPMEGFFNGLNFTNQQPHGLNIMSNSRFIGAWCEGCVVNNGTFRPTMYVSVLNAMAEIDKMPNARFVELNHDIASPGSASQIAQRVITTAIAWLGYSEGHTVVYPDLEANTKNLAVFPENSIYPTGPLQTMSTGAADIQVAPGIYRREFSACYNAGVAIGPCASIVNGTNSTVVVKSTWLRQTYGHVVTMSGGDIPTGGKVDLTSTRFTANSTTLAGARGLLIVR